MADSRRKIRPITQMLDDPNKGINKTYGGWGVLSKLWRIILKQNQISGYRFSVLMDRYIKDPANRSRKSEGEHFDNRGNLNKEFSNPTMSWKVFLKGMRFMQFIEFRITIEARHRDGHISVHKTMYNLDENLLVNDPRFREEIEAAAEASQTDPNAPNLPIPEDQEPMPFMDPYPDDDDDTKPANP